LDLHINLGLSPDGALYRDLMHDQVSVPVSAIVPSPISVAGGKMSL
jgi:hypothetical protein